MPRGRALLTLSLAALALASLRCEGTRADASCPECNPLPPRRKAQSRPIGGTGRDLRRGAVIGKACHVRLPQRRAARWIHPLGGRRLGPLAARAPLGSRGARLLAR